MTRWLPVAAVLAALAATARPAAAQLPPDKALASMKAGDGLRVELFAHEPMLINPTSMDVDHRGRVWITEAVNYRRKLFGRPMLRPEGDRIVVLTDKDGDGKADESTVFYQGQDLYGPLGIAVAKDAAGPGYRVFVCQSPDILLFHDKDGDGKADGPPEKFLTGFGGFDHDHGVHGINIGPDGKLYFTVGDAGVKGLQARDGKGPKWTSNATDCRAGTVWRCDIDGKNLELIAHNFRNNYECCVDSFGEIWLSDNDDDGNQQTRICYVMPGGNYGYHPRGPGQSHWHEEQPGIVHKALRTGFGSPTGICFYEGTLLPEKFRGQLIHADAGPREVRCFHRKPKGAGYELDKTLMLTSTDNWFRPSDVCVAPDGSIFVADWYDPGVGGHGMGDWTRGRVYRLTPQGHKGYKVPEVKLKTTNDLLQALGSPCQATRAVAIDAFRQMPNRKISQMIGGELFDDLIKGKTITVEVLARTTWRLAEIIAKKPLDDESTGIAMSYMGIYDTFPEREMPSALAMYFRLLPTISRHGFVPALLMKGPKNTGEVLEAMLANLANKDIDNKPGLRECLLGLSKIEPQIAQRPFYILAKRYDGQDHFYRAALNIACGTDPARRDTILADFDKHFPEWNDKVADLVWELRPKSVLPRLERLLADPTLTVAQKGRIVDILAVNDDPSAGKMMLGLLFASQPTEVKVRALENLRLFLPGKWNGLSTGDALKTAIARLLAGPQTRVIGLQLVAAAQDTAALAAVAEIATDRGASADVRAEAIRTMGKLRDPKAVEALQTLLADPAVAADSVRAVGDQVSGRVDTPAAKQALAALQRIVTGDESPAVRKAAVAALAGSRAGTGWLLQLREKKQLPDLLAADAGRLLRNSPFQGERNKALLLFPAPGKLDPKKLPPATELAHRRGNAEAGKAILAKSAGNEVQCLKCHAVRGQGGQIGPDLSMIGKKGSRENLFESILQPSKAIADQYASWKVDTADGLSITGLLVQETDKQLTLRDANGKDYEIPMKDVEKRTKSLVSLMPDSLAGAMTEDELVDLVEYLTTLQTAALTPTVWTIAGPFPSPGGNAGLDTDFGPEKAAFDPKAKFHAGGTPSEVAWRPIRTGPGGYIDLRAFHGDRAADSVSYLYAEVESPEAQDATVLLGTDDGAKLFVNGERVFGSTATRAAAPEQDAVPVRLKKGANALLLKIANGAGPHGFYLTVLSGQELKAK